MHHARSSGSGQRVVLISPNMQLPSRTPCLRLSWKSFGLLATCGLVPWRETSVVPCGPFPPPPAHVLRSWAPVVRSPVGPFSAFLASCSGAASCTALHSSASAGWCSCPRTPPGVVLLYSCHRHACGLLVLVHSGWRKAVSLHLP